MPIMYPLQLTGASIVGQAVVRSPADRTSADGYIVGAVNSPFHLDRDHLQVTVGLQVEIGMRLNLSGRSVDTRWRQGGSPWGPWEEVVGW